MYQGFLVPANKKASIPSYKLKGIGRDVAGNVPGIPRPCKKHAGTPSCKLQGLGKYFTGNVPEQSLLTCSLLCSPTCWQTRLERTIP